MSRGEKIDNYEDEEEGEEKESEDIWSSNGKGHNDIDENKQVNELLHERSPTHGYAAPNFKRDLRVHRTFAGVGNIISVQNVEFDINENQNVEEKDIIKGLDYLKSNSRCNWNEKSKKISIYFKNQDRGEKFYLDVKNIMSVGEKLQGLDLEFEDQFLEERAVKEVSHLITYNTSLNYLGLIIREPKKGETIDFKILSQGFNSFSALKELCLIFYITLDVTHAIPLFTALGDLVSLEVFKLRFKTTPKLEFEGYSALSKALKQFTKLRTLQIKDLPVNKHEHFLNIDTVFQIYKNLISLDLKLPTISESASTFPVGISNLTNLNEIKWTSKVLPKGFVQGLGYLKHLYSLKLHLTDNISDVIDAIKSLGGLAELEIVYPENHEVKLFDLKALLKAITTQNYLSSLTLMVGRGATSFAPKGISKFLKKLTKLRVLNFAIYGKMSSKGFNSLTKGLSKLEKLEELRLEFPDTHIAPWTISGNDFFKFAQILKEIPKLSMLTLIYLNIKGCSNRLYELFCSHNLKHFELIIEDCSELDSKCLRQCATELKGFLHLEQLVIGFNKISKIDYHAFRDFISSIENLTTLKQLDLQFTGCQHLADEFPTVARLPMKLVDLEIFTLNLSECKHLISKGGLNFLVDAISRNKSVKTVSFKLLECTSLPATDIISFQDKLEKIPTLKRVSVYSSL